MCPKAGDLDWSDLMKGKVGEPEDHRSRPVQARGPLNKSERPPMPSDKEIRDAVLSGAPRQPTDEELFGDLVKSEEELKKEHESWENTINKFYAEAKKPVEKQPQGEWAGRGSYMDELSDEEREQWNMHIGDGPFKG